MPYCDPSTAAMKRQQEHYDFIVPKMRSERSAVRRSCEILNDPRMLARLSATEVRI